MNVSKKTMMATTVVKTFTRSATTSYLHDYSVQHLPFTKMPGPKPLPVVGNIWRYFPIIGNYSLERLHKSYESMYHEFGPIVKEHVFADRVLVHVFDPKDMYTVYKNEGKYPERLSHTALAKYRREKPDFYRGPGLFPSNGEEWYDFRMKFQNILLSGTASENCSGAIEEVTEDLIATIPTKLDEKNEMDILPLLFHWAVESIGAVLYHRRLGFFEEKLRPLTEKLVRVVHQTHEAVFHTENSPLRYQKYYDLLEGAQDFLSAAVLKKCCEAKGLLFKGKYTQCLYAQMMTSENVDAKDVFTMIMDMFLAGIDTTAYSLAFTLYNLAQNPDVQEKLRQDLMEKLPTKESRMTKNRSRFRYLQLVINESLRMNPVSVGTGRITPTDIVLGGYHVPAKTMVILQHQVASMLPKYFPNPRKFIPERWEENEMGIVSSPFGHGPRMCIGHRIARKELSLAVAKLVRNFYISYHYEDIDSCNKLINIPDKPVRLRFEPVPN